MTKFMDDVKSRGDAGLIEEGRMLVATMERSQMRLGKLALAFAPMGEAGAKSGAEARIAIFAREVGCEASTLRISRTVAHAWSQFALAEDEFSFTILRQLATVGDKEKALAVLREVPEDGWTTRTAMEAMAADGLLPKAKMDRYKATNAKGGMARRAELVRLEHALEALKSVNVSKVPRASRNEALRVTADLAKEVRRVHAGLSPSAPVKGTGELVAA